MNRFARINLAKAKARSKSVSVSTPMGIAEFASEIFNAFQSKLETIN
jgi:hypothetical protein